MMLAVDVGIVELTKYSVYDVAVLVDFLQPPLYVHKTLSICDIIHYNHTVCASIVPAGGEESEYGSWYSNIHCI